jgi:hypothetical protein
MPSSNVTIHDVTSLAESGKSFLVHCLACGFDTNLPAPEGSCVKLANIRLHPTAAHVIMGRHG